MRFHTIAALFVLLLGFIVTTPLLAGTLPALTVYKDPRCGCCEAWARHMSEAGFAVTTRDVADLAERKRALGVPAHLGSCHTAQVGGYVIEGHVPAASVKRLLREKQAAAGLAVSGMPIGSPGMEGPNPEAYEVQIYDAHGSRVFDRY
ncbi:MAG: DUF411 domain-containing protein [Pseudomonadota bacterium]|nr:DUF411 domain-containing protein [Pseudomonadota bacterium]